MASESLSHRASEAAKWTYLSADHKRLFLELSEVTGDLDEYAKRLHNENIQRLRAENETLRAEVEKLRGTEP